MLRLISPYPPTECRDRLNRRMDRPWAQGAGRDLVGAARGRWLYVRLRSAGFDYLRPCLIARITAGEDGGARLVGACVPRPAAMASWAAVTAAAALAGTRAGDAGLAGLLVLAAIVLAAASYRIRSRADGAMLRGWVAMVVQGREAAV